MEHCRWPPEISHSQLLFGSSVTAASKSIHLMDLSPAGLMNQRCLMNQPLVGKHKFIKPPNVLSKTSPLGKSSHWGFFPSIQLHLSFISIQSWEVPELEWCFPGYWLGRSNLNCYYFLPSSQGEPVLQKAGQTGVSHSCGTLVRAGDWKGHMWVWY